MRSHFKHWTDRLFKSRNGRRTLVALSLLTLLSLFSCTSRRSAAKPPVDDRPAAAIPAPESIAILGTPRIRVVVAKSASDLRVTVPPGGARMRYAGTAEGRALPGGLELAISLRSTGLALNSENLGAPGELRIESNSAREMLLFDGKPLAPELRLNASGAGMTAIAHLDLEVYLTGVLAGEVPYSRWGSEALKAQAVASRTYALYQMKQHRLDAYDVEATTADQVFRPGAQDEPVLRRAIEETYGLALTSGGRLFPAFFHSTCGGHTDSAAGVFPEQALVEPLKGAACPFCTESPSYRWQTEIAKTTLRERLAAGGVTVGAIQALVFEGGDTANGWPPRRTQVRIVHTGGETVLGANRFRLLAGAGQLKSVMFENVADTGSGFAFAGRGFGHGVGLCQYGSQGMAREGYRFQQILGLYYPGAELTKVYSETVASR